MMVGLAALGLMVESFTYDITTFESLLSGYLAGLTAEYGLGRCYERAKAALALAPDHLQQRLTYVEGTLHNGVGFEPFAGGDHAWLMLEVEEGYAVIDPSVAAFILDGGTPAEMVWELVL